MLSKDNILMGREKEYPTTKEMEDNLDVLLSRLYKFCARLGYVPKINSGYRPGHYNAEYSKSSPHLTCSACDFNDRDGTIKLFVKNNLSILEDCDLYMEDPGSTLNWVHLDIRKRKNRIFIP